MKKGTSTRGRPGGRVSPGGSARVFCPLCGISNSAGAITCAACGSGLDIFGREGPDADGQRCPRCGRITPALAGGRAAYCMQCGKPLRAALAVLPATPDPDLCPLCQQRCAPVTAAYREATDDLARELAPPRRPLRARLFGAEGGPTVGGVAAGGARRKLRASARVAGAAARAYTLLVWALAGLALVLLLLALNKVGSYKELPSVVQSGRGVGGVIAARVAASLPYLLGALGALAAALALLALRATVDKLRKDPVIAYQLARKNWESAHYCPTDRVVFIRTVTAVRWDPVEELHRLIRQEHS